MVVGSLWLLFSAFQEGWLWGFACLFLPFATLLFLFVHWKRASKPFCCYVVGAVLFVVWTAATTAMNPPKAGAQQAVKAAPPPAEQRTMKAAPSSKKKLRRLAR